MKLDKIRNSGLGIVLAALAVLIAARVVRLVSWTIVRTGGYALLAGILVLAVTAIRKRS